MKKQILSILPLLVACQFVTAEETQEASGFYGSAFGGAAIFNDGSVDVSTNTSGAADFEIEAGLSLGLRLGYDFGTFRVEGEYTYASGDIESLETSTGDVSVDSDITSNAVMLNALVDFDLSSSVLLSAGVGIGASNVQYGSVEIGGSTVVDAVDETVFSYQGIIRASYLLSENATLGVSYRYLVTDDVSGSGGVITSSPDQRSEIDFDSVGVSLFEIFFSYEF
jgi:opacity protein-like surface antigen